MLRKIGYQTSRKRERERKLNEYVWFLVFQGTSHMEGFHIDGKSLPQAAPVGDYKMELIITRKVDNKQTPIFNMVVFATLAFKDA